MMHRNRTLLLFLAVTLIFGTAFPAVKAGLSFFPPVLFVAIRNLLAGILLLTYIAVSSDYRRPRSRGDWTAVVAGGVFLVGGTALGFVGQQFITSGVAAVIFTLSPIVTVLLAWVLLPAERLSARDSTGIVLGFLGVVIIVQPDPAALLDPELVGKLLVLAAVAVVALGAVLIRRSRPTMPVPALTGWAMLLGATIQFGVAVAVGESVTQVQVTPLAVGLLLYLAVAIGAIGLVLYLSLQATIGAVKANLSTYLTPVVAVALGVVFLDEAVQPLTLVGFAVIVLGFALLESRALVGELNRYRGLAR